MESVDSTSLRSGAGICYILAFLPPDRPLGRGVLGGGGVNSVVSSTFNALANRSTVFNVGFSKPRSRRLTYVRSKAASIARFS